MFSFLSRLFGGSAADPAVAKQRVEAGALLLDVRTPGEFSGGHLPDAVNVPVSDLPARFSELDTSRGVVVYCRSGMRSARAATFLKQQGVEDVHDIGPMSAWPA